MKKGDRVRCLDDAPDSLAVHYPNGLPVRVGDVYTVSRVDGEFVYLEGVKSASGNRLLGLLQQRFELIAESATDPDPDRKFEVGDEVICVDDDAFLPDGTRWLTRGQRYTVTHTWEGLVFPLISITDCADDPTGGPAMWRVDRFEFAPKGSGMITGGPIGPPPDPNLVDSRDADGKTWRDRHPLF